MAKDKDAKFEVLYRQYYARVFRFLVQQRLAHDIAHDLAQETFIRAWRAFDSYRNGGWSFFATIARNVLYNWLRARHAGKRNGRNVDLDDPEFKQEIVAPHVPDYAERDDATRKGKRVQEAIAELPETQRRVLELQLEGLKYEQIAKRMGITLDAVKTRRKEALKTLRLKLGDIDWLDRLPEEDQ